MNDLKFAIRQLLKNPGFTAVVVVTVAVGRYFLPEEDVHVGRNSVVIISERLSKHNQTN